MTDAMRDDWKQAWKDEVQRAERAEARVAELEAARDMAEQDVGEWVRRATEAEADRDEWRTAAEYEKAQALRFRDEGNAWKIDRDAALDLLRRASSYLHQSGTPIHEGDWRLTVDAIDAFLARVDSGAPQRERAERLRKGLEWALDFIADGGSDPNRKCRELRELVRNG